MMNPTRGVNADTPDSHTRSQVIPSLYLLLIFKILRLHRQLVGRDNVYLKKKKMFRQKQKRDKLPKILDDGLSILKNQQ